MKPKWQKLVSLAQEICTLYFQFFGAVFASKGYPFKNIFVLSPFRTLWRRKCTGFSKFFSYSENGSSGDPSCLKSMLNI